MGFAKNRMLEQEGHGYRLDASGSSVCGTCVDDYALAEVVAAHATDAQCAFCGAESDEPIAADVETVLAHMGDSIDTEYDQAVAALYRDEGEYIGSTYTIEDVLEQEGWDGHPDLRAVILSAFSDGHYCQRDPYVLNEFDALHLGWREFCETVMKEARFTFMLTPDFDDGEHGHPVLRGGAMLANLGALMQEHALYRELHEGHRWLRVRPINKDDAGYSTAEDLGAPPSRKAKPNRMSPAGISMFYGSDDEQTAIQEALGARSDTGGKDAMVATFETTASGLVIDLTAVPQTPSLFDDANRDKRARLGFLNGFAFDVSRPLSPEDEQQTEYVPTQIVCEFLRYHFRTQGGQQPVGLVFRSAKDREKLNVVYFVDAEGCFDPDAEVDGGTFGLLLTDVLRRRL